MEVVFYPGHHGLSYAARVPLVLPASRATGHAFKQSEVDGGVGPEEQALLVSGPPGAAAADAKPPAVPDRLAPYLEALDAAAVGSSSSTNGARRSGGRAASASPRGGKGHGNKETGGPMVGPMFLNDIWERF